MQIESLLGFARRAGALAIGTEAAIAAVENGRASLLLVSADASPRTWKKLSALCSELPVVRYGRKKELGQRLGYSGEVAVLAVTQAQFAQTILRLTAENRIGGMTDADDS